MSRRLGFAATLAVAALTLVTPSPSRAATPFSLDTPDTSYALWPSAVFDGAGNPHLSWLAFGFENSIIRYATKRQNAWVVENVDTVDASLYTGSYTSIALDPEGNPHIAYYEHAAGALRYASRGGSGWSKETVDDDGDVGSYASLAIGPTGVAHISYYDLTNEQLKYANNLDGWYIEPVDPATDVGYYTAIAVDPTERPHISYYDYAAKDLKYATKGEPFGSTWTIQRVDTTGTTGQYTSIAVDPRGNPSISYFDATNKDLRFAYKVGSSWTKETVDTTGIVGYATCLRLDSSNNAHISYNDGTNMKEKYASRSSAGSWTTEVADASSRATSWGSGLALDPQDNPVIAYWADGDQEYLRLADATVRLTAPAGGESWPVGALRSIRWTGAGSVSLFLSTDGGATYEELVANTDVHLVPVRVPDVSAAYARVKVVRGSPLSYDVSDSLFEITSSVDLLSFTAGPASGGGVSLDWHTDPGPEDLAGYKLERQGERGDWITVATLQHQPPLIDPTGSPADRYRLTAINNYGHSILVGETQGEGGGALRAYPVPLRTGPLLVVFSAGRSTDPHDAVEIFDVSGRLMRTLAKGPFVPGTHQLSWDGRDGTGELVSNGLYFVRARHDAQVETVKLVMAR